MLKEIWEKICRTCKFGIPDGTSGRICSNSRSRSYGKNVSSNDSCDRWTKKRQKRKRK